MRACDRHTEDADFGKKKIIFSGKAHFDIGGYVNKHLGHRKPARIHWKPEAPKTSHRLVRILILNELLFTKIEEKDIGNIWFQQDRATWHTAEATLDLLRPVCEDHIISHRATSELRHCWTIICGVPSKISVTPTRQRCVNYSWSHWWNTAAHNR